MFGFLVNIGLLVLAGITSNNGRAEKNRMRKKESEVEEVVREYSTLQAQFQNLLHNEDKEFEKKENLWKKAFDEERGKANMVERTMRETLEERRNELASLKRLDPEVIEKREEELEDERMAVRYQIAIREAKIAELRNALGCK